MRAFIAIELPQDIKEAIGRLQAKLKQTGADVKWVSPANIHLTLKFLGEIDEKTKDAVCNAMRSAVADIRAFPIKLGELGAFPGMQSPRVIWIGLSEGHDRVKAIAQHLEHELGQCGKSREEREFSSHITIARVRSQKNKDALAAGISAVEGSTAGKLEGFTAKKITLFKSTLLPQGPVYEILQETNLKTI
jgi:RNA 2',3'-cyclic 3'-phosphodiesterase